MHRFLSLLAWVLRFLIFIALFGLAIKNSGPMELRFYFDQVWQAPVSVVLLLSFALGVLLGLTAVLGIWIRYKTAARSGQRGD